VLEGPRLDWTKWRGLNDPVQSDRGNAKRKKGDVEGAIDDYNRAIKLGPQSPDAIIQDLALFVSQNKLVRPEEPSRDRSPGKRIRQTPVR
jgi:hypothetical protein